jgi:hypothetical protein
MDACVASILLRRSDLTPGKLSFIMGPIASPIAGTESSSSDIFAKSVVCGLSFFQKIDFFGETEKSQTGLFGFSLRRVFAYLSLSIVEKF